MDENCGYKIRSVETKENLSGTKVCKSCRYRIIDPLVPKDMFRLVFFVKPVFFAREGVAF